MGKVRKKRGIKFDYDRKRNKNKRKKPKDMPSIKCDEIKKAWDVTKNVKQNLAEMGISYDPNKSVKAGKKKKMVAVLDDDKNWNFEEMEPDVEKTPIKKYVIDDLEMKSKIPGKKKIWISQNDADFCVYMMDKYGDNYIKMARDDKNYYQETPKQIERKINKFKSVPKMFEAYMNRKKDADGTRSRPPLVTLSPHRYMTRWSEACRRNGHFSSPPLPDTQTYAPNASLCRVRRRLQFGRKPPKERDALISERLEPLPSLEKLLNE